nr:ribonuclease H-like domain-containing protein [Tanacetum cinerariifolium]
MTGSPFVDSGFDVPIFSPEDDPIACLNKAMAFLTDEKAMLAEAQEAGQILDEEQLAFPADPRIPADQAQKIIPHNTAFQTEGLDTYNSDCDDLSTAQAVLIANISNYGSDVISEVSLVNASLKKLKFHLTQFNSVVKKRTTPNALGEEYFEKNDLKAQLQDKDTTICKLKDTIKSLRKNTKEEIVDHDRCDLATINVELEKSVAKLLSENERLCKEINHVKQVFKDLSKPSGNTKNNKISQPSSSSKINKVEDQPRSVKTRKNQKNYVNKVKCNDHVMQSMSNMNSVYVSIKNTHVKDSMNDVTYGCLYAICGKCMIFETHHTCVHLVVTKMNESKKSKSVTKHKNQNVWKPRGNVFTDVGYKWKPTGQTFTILGNSCPLSRITSTNVVPPKQTPSHSVEIHKPEIKVYSRKPKNVNNAGSSKMAKIVEYKNANHSEPNHNWGSIATDIPSSSSFVLTGCPDCTLIARIMGYGDYQLGNVIILKVYYIEGLGHNLFSVGQFRDADLKVAFQKNTCFIRNLEGVDLLSGSRDTNLYIISLDDMLKSSLICIISKASKTKSWLWHRRLSHLNFGTLNKLAKDGLARGIPRLKFQKDHLYSACALWKSKKSSHQLKVEDTNQEKLYLLHMDLCGPMCVASINEKRYILVIVDDYSRFTCEIFKDKR